VAKEKENITHSFYGFERIISQFRIINAVEQTPVCSSVLNHVVLTISTFPLLFSFVPVFVNSGFFFSLGGLADGRNGMRQILGAQVPFCFFVFLC
jgi:hypothetical protein